MTVTRRGTTINLRVGATPTGPPRYPIPYSQAVSDRRGATLNLQVGAA